MSYPDDRCARCQRKVLDLMETDDGGVCDGCLTVEEQESVFEHGTATPPPSRLSGPSAAAEGPDDLPVAGD